MCIYLNYYYIIKVTVKIIENVNVDIFMNISMHISRNMTKSKNDYKCKLGYNYKQKY